MLLALIAAGSASWLASGTLVRSYPYFEGSAPWLAVQLAFWTAGGIGVLALALAELRERRDAAAWLLALWVLGTFTFAGFVNWTVNGRSILPLVPAVAILIARRLERRPVKARGLPGGLGVPLAASAALALLVAWADHAQARAVRRTVRSIEAEVRDDPSARWFLGHWGFQYHMQAIGGLPVDERDVRLEPGDCLFVPMNNPTRILIPPETTRREGQFSASGPRWLGTLSGAQGAGFYGSFWGPLPFAFGPVPAERVLALRIVARVGGEDGR
jgi:hypothetical protein